MDNSIQDMQAERVNRFFNRLSTLQCLRYLIKAILMLKFIQVIFNIFILYINRTTTCKSPLKLFLSVYTILIILQSIIAFLRNREYFGINRMPSLQENSELSLLNNFIDAFTLFWYLTGFHWVHESKLCKVTSPSLYYTSVAWIYMGFFIIVSPLIAIVVLIFLITYIRPKLPISTYTKDSNIKSSDANCTICLSDYRDGDKVKSLPCQHHFHLGCIDEWFKVDDICPLCKKPIHILYDLIDEQENV